MPVAHTAEQKREILARWDMITWRDCQGYEEVLGHNPLQLALDGLKANDRFVWYDLACGDFEAGTEVWRRTDKRATVIGVELDPNRPGERAPNLALREGDIIDYPIPTDVDLITCVHGLYYVEKLQPGGTNQALQNWYNAMPNGARLLANISPQMPRFDATLKAMSQALDGYTFGSWATIDMVVLDITKTDQLPSIITLQ
ncbi:MAG TPA: hypothetical protein VLI54_02630 [Bacillota bacterium]|nr:hypothetical protein [Bacillota bacterium]